MSKKITNTFENLLSKYRVNNLTKVVDYLLSISRRSKRTAFAYSFALDHLNKFVERNYNNYNIQTILEPLKKEERQEKENNIIDVYNLLDRFVSYLHNDTINGHDLSPLSVKLYMAAAKSYLSYNDLEITASKFKRRVKMPPVYREDEEAVDAKDIRQILLACNNRRLKAYLLVLASGGMRATEALAIRLKDINDSKDGNIDWSITPTKVHIRKEYAKTRVSRDVYISDEATNYLKKWIEWKYRDRRYVLVKKVKNGDDTVFSITSSSRDPHALYTKVLLEFQKVLDLADFKSRKGEGVYKRRKITFHSFRRFVKSTISNKAGYDYSEWLLGHSTKSVYYTMKEPERRSKYREQCMDYLTYLDYSLLEAKGKDVESQLEERKQEIKQLKQRDKTNDEAIAKMQEQLTKLQDEVSLQYRMSLGWATETSHWSERLVEEMKKVEDISTMRDLKKWKEMRKEYLKKAEEEKRKSIESYLKKKK